MLTAEEIKEKVYWLVDEFERYYRLKNYAMAKSCYERALTVCNFCDFDQKDIYTLFMSKADDDADRPDWTGGFDQDKARECYEWCRRRGDEYATKPFPGNPLKKP